MLEKCVLFSRYYERLLDALACLYVIVAVLSMQAGMPLLQYVPMWLSDAHGAARARSMIYAELSERL